jgi:hypothetical protein
MKEHRVDCGWITLENSVFKIAFNQQNVVRRNFYLETAFSAQN